MPGTGDGSPAPGNGDGGRTLKMGILMGVTGGLKSLGPPIRNAAELAVNDVKDANTNFSVDTQFEDTGTKPSQGVSGAEALVNAGYPMIAGALSSEVSLQVAKNVCIPNEITQCSPASTSPKFTTLDDNDYWWRTTPHDALQGRVLANIAAKRLNHTKTSTLFLNNAYGKGLSEAYATAFKTRHDGTVTNKVAFAKGQSSYTSQLQKALKNDPGVMMVVGYPDSGIQLFKDFYSEFDSDDMDVLVPDGLKDKTLPNKVGFDMTNVRGTAPTAAGPGESYFNSAYKNAYGSSPGPFTSQSYDAAAVLLLANAAAGSNNGKKVRNKMRNVTNPGGEKITPKNFPSALSKAAAGTDINYQGVSGPVTFDDVGDQKAAVYSYFQFTKSGLKTIENITFTGGGG